MKEAKRTFSPGKSDIFWCPTCNVPLLSLKCSLCGGLSRRIRLSPPADVRLCSLAGRDLLRELFLQNYGEAAFLDDRIILLNKIAGMDRRDQVILDGHHIATLWFDIAANNYRLDLELAGASLLAKKAKKMVVGCSEALMKGHLKGKWIDKDQVKSWPGDLQEGDCVILRIGKYTGVGVVRRGCQSLLSIRVKDVSREELRLSPRQPKQDDVIKANEGHLKKLERIACRELEDFLSKNKLPVNVSFSGGKDSLACLILALKVRPLSDILFINTGLEFPETVDYVRKLCKAQKLKLYEISGQDRFFSQAQLFGPPAKDYRWCCKTNKLGPLTDFIAERYPEGCVTVEGRRIYESFNRARIGFIERNPYVPGQLTLSPIRNWRALEVVLYVLWNKQPLNPLYERDYERIGCWLCPASLQSEFINTQKTHPQLYEKWDSFLRRWAEESGLDQRYIDLGFWRWKRHPPKIREMAQAENIKLAARAAHPEDIGLEVVRGRSPCGLTYSVEASLKVPQNHPFSAVARALCMIGEVKFSEDLGTAVVKTESGRITVFASGHIMIIASQKEAEELLQKAVKTIVRVQMCTACGICEKNCKRGAIKVRDTITIDERKCIRCGKCEQGCIAVEKSKALFTS